MRTKILVPLGLSSKPAVVSVQNFLLVLALVAVPVILMVIAISILTIATTFWYFDFLVSSLIVGITLYITILIVSRYPYVFSIRNFRLPGFFVIPYIGFILLPLPFVYADYPTLARTTFLFATTIGFLCLLIGIVVIHQVFPSSPEHIRKWVTTPIHTTPMLRLAVIPMLVLCIALFAMYVAQVGQLPIMKAMQGGFSTTDLAQAREDALKLIPGRIRYVYDFLRQVLFPYTTLLLLTFATTSRAWVWKLLFVVSFMINMVLASATLEKSVVGTFLIMIFLNRLLLQGKTFSLRMIIIAVILGLIFPVFVIFATYQFNIESWRIFNAIILRLFYLPAEVALYYFEYFPKEHSFLLGRSLLYISKLFPEGPFPIANTIGLYMRPDTLKSGSANCAYIGYLWADFGWVGVIIGSLLSGFVIGGVQLFIMRLPKSAPTLVLYTLSIFYVSMLWASSIPKFLDIVGTVIIGITLPLLFISRISRFANI